MSPAGALLPDGTIREFGREEMKLGYRRSVFAENGGIILSCTVRLAEGRQEEILARMKDLAARRTEKQPLNLPSAGSTFKRPEGYFAGKLIEEAGCRGLAAGGARVSQKHAGFVVNEGGASAEDVMTLIDLVRMTVRDHSGVELEPEVRIIGEKAAELSRRGREALRKENRKNRNSGNRSCGAERSEMTEYKKWNINLHLTGIHIPYILTAGAR